MKRIFMIVAVTMALLGGCQQNQTGHLPDYRDAIEKAQAVTIAAADAAREMTTLTDREEIARLVEHLDLGAWTVGELPPDAEEVGSFTWAQEKTIQFGEDATDGALHDICKITLYDSPHIGFDLAGLHVIFEISQESADYLRGYF